jgi:hypothetical protein
MSVGSVILIPFTWGRVQCPLETLNEDGVLIYLII